MQQEGRQLQHAASVGVLGFTAGLPCPSQRAVTCLRTKTRTSEPLIFKQIISFFF